MKKTSLWSKLKDKEAWRWAFKRRWDVWKYSPWFNWICLQAFREQFAGFAHYRFLKESEVTQTRKSDTLFLFGSGYSINDLTEAECRFFEKHDTMGFNWFLYQNIVRCDYYMIREVLQPLPHMGMLIYWYRRLKRYGQMLHKSFYKNTIFIMQKGWRAIPSNRLIGFQWLPKGARIYRFFLRSRGKLHPPTKTLSRGLTNAVGVLCECLNFAYHMRWKRIVLVGVDLYDSRYFWLKDNEIRYEDTLRNYKSVNVPHATSRYVIDLMRDWKPYFVKRGISVEVYNPKSLLNDVFDVFDRNQITEELKTV